MQAMLATPQPSVTSLRQSGCARPLPQPATAFTRRTALRSSTQLQHQQHQQQPHQLSAVRASRRPLACRAANDKQSNNSAASLASKFNPIYAGITGAFGALFLFRNPYIFAVLTIATVLPQNSNVTSLNNLVLIFYESGLFMNFAEAVYCVRLVTWLSMICMVFSFAIFQ